MICFILLRFDKDLDMKTAIRRETVKFWLDYFPLFMPFLCLLYPVLTSLLKGSIAAGKC
jgi:hypothetical protein